MAKQESMNSAAVIADENDVPPLEDMSELLNKMETLKTNLQYSSHLKNEHEVSSMLQSQNSHKENISIHDERKSDVCGSQSKPSAFGGMKKGFLFGSSQTDKSKKSTDTIPTIKPSNKSEDKHRIQEVQDALKVGQQFADKEWVTDDLLENLQKNEKLLTKLQNPYFMQAITEFQTNPQAALAKYNGNAEMESFFKEFCGLLGTHFTHLANSQSQHQSASSDIKTREAEEVDIQVHNPHEEEDQKVQELLADPEIRETLLDPDIHNLIETLKNNPHEAQRILQRSSSDLKLKVSKLVDRGVLQFQR